MVLKEGSQIPILELTSGLPAWRETALSKIIQNGCDYESVAMVFIA